MIRNGIHKRRRRSTMVNASENEKPNSSGDTRDIVSILENRGFIVQEGQLKYIDILKMCSEGFVDNCLAQNVGAPYAACLLPPAPGQESYADLMYDSQYPPNINFLAPGLTYKLRPDEALVLIGITPPEAYYFAFRSYVGFVENEPMKDYSDAVTAGDEGT